LSRDRDQQRRGRHQNGEDDRSDRWKHSKGELTYKERQISYLEEEGEVRLSIDGVEVGPVSRVGEEEYHIHLFPFRAYPSLEALGRALVDTEGELWVIDRGSPGK